MKHITKILCLAAGLLGATSCSDFLDQTSPSEMTGQNVFGSAYYTGLAINKLYGAMAQDDTYSQAIPIVWSTNTDCELIDGLGDNATASNERGVMNYNSFAGWNRIARLWDAMYGIIENVSDREYVIEGSMNLDDVNERLGTDLASEDYDSLGGFIIGRLDRLPEAGDEVVTEDGIRLVVDALEKNRIEKVHVYLPEK